MGKQRIALRTDSAYRQQVDRRALVALASRVLREEGYWAPAELSIYITDDTTIQRLNREFHGSDEPTDVLAFPLTEGGALTAEVQRAEHEETLPAFITPPGMMRNLGEVVISYPTALRQAQELGHPADEELAHLLTHGVLHILGYDHLEPSEEVIMRSREEHLLEGLRHDHDGKP